MYYKSPVSVVFKQGMYHEVKSKPCQTVHNCRLNALCIIVLIIWYFCHFTSHVLQSLINGVQHDWRVNLVRSNIDVKFAREYESRSDTEWLMGTCDRLWVVLFPSFLVLWPVYVTRLMFSCKELMYKLLVKLSLIFHGTKLSTVSIILFDFLSLMLVQ